MTINRTIDMGYDHILKKYQNQKGIHDYFNNDYTWYDAYKNEVNLNRVKELEKTLSFYATNFPLQSSTFKIFQGRPYNNQHKDIIENVKLREVDWLSLLPLNVVCYLRPNEDGTSIILELVFETETDFVIWKLKN